MDKFKQLVKQMREAQKDYFKNRTQSSLQRAKHLETQVDAQLAKAQAEESVVQQPSLFAEPVKE